MIEDTDFRVYTAICRGLDHEAKVMGDRIQWAISFTSGLFAASALLITVMVLGKPDPIARGGLLVVLGGVAFVGVVFSLTTRAGVRAAQRQFRYLCKQYEDRDDIYEKTLLLPRPYGDQRAHRYGNLSARVFPMMMFFCWAMDLGLSWVIAYSTLRAEGWSAVWAYLVSLVT